MKMVAVTTLRDTAGAEVAKEVLSDHGIAVEIRRLGSNPYFGSPTAEEFEVRVPEDAVAKAHELLEGMAEELERAALAEAGVPPSDEDERGGDELPPPELRPRKVSWALALALVGPVPGCGVFYARAYALGWAMLALAVASFVVATLTADGKIFAILLALKGADIVLAPIAAARFNRKLRERHAARA
jgi:hypothetical protein